MLMPSIFGENLFDDWFDEFPFYDMDKEMNNTEKKLYGKKAGRIMKTDIKEKKDGYELVVDLPGFSKDEIKASVANGYLTISAAKGLDKDEKEKDSGHYIRKERYAGACERSFYVGDNVEQEDVKAEFKHGILKLFVPKKEAKSGTGKSTHTNLWHKLYDTPLINGDLNLLSFKDGTPVVYGLPWCGTSEIFDIKTYPLGGIILLQQASENHIESLELHEKALLVSQRLISPSWTKEQLHTNLHFTENLSSEIYVARLCCNMGNAAAATMKEAIDDYLKGTATC